MKKLFAILLLTLFSLSGYAQPSSDKLIRQGASFHDRGRYMEAISCYQQALKVNPSSMSAVYEMSLSYLMLKDYDNAIKHSTRVISTNFRPLLVDAYVVKGTALAAKSKLDDAINLFTKALSECGGEYLLHYNLGLSYYKADNTNLALLQLRKAIEKDATHSGAFLLYAYVLNDSDKWVQSFLSFHFFLLLEPNTDRSAEAFREMYNLIDQKRNEGDVRLKDDDGIMRGMLYHAIQARKTGATDTASRYKFFADASQEVFICLVEQGQSDDRNVFWNFFVPVYQEILESGHFDTYCRYVSVSYFPESLKWWEDNKSEVDNFIEWFEHGITPDMEEDAYFESE